MQANGVPLALFLEFQGQLFTLREISNFNRLVLFELHYSPGSGIFGSRHLIINAVPRHSRVPPNTMEGHRRGARVLRAYRRSLCIYLQFEPASRTRDGTSSHLIVKYI